MALVWIHPCNKHLKESSGSSLLNEVPIDVDGAGKEFGDL